MLVEQLTTTFDATKYNDEYRSALMELIDQKKSEELTVTPSEKGPDMPSNVMDLMTAFQASLDKTKPKKKPAARKKTTKTVKKNA